MDPAVATAVKAHETIVRTEENLRLLRRESKALLARLTQEQLKEYGKAFGWDEEG